MVRRTATTLLAATAVLSATYVFVTIAPPPEGGDLAWQAPPTLDAYVTWLLGMVTLDWGTSTVFGDPVTELVWIGLRRTAAYVLPAAFLSTALGTVVGLRAAIQEDALLDDVVSLASYVGLGVPNFLIGVVLLLLFATDSTGAVVHTEDAIQTVLWPALVLTTTLTAAQIRYTRNEAGEYAHSDLARLVRATGGGRRDIYRHVVRNAAVPLVSLFFTELLGVLLLNIYVIESVFAIRGLGYLNFFGVMRGDVPVVVGSTVVFVLVGVGGSYVQDLAYVALDPRFGESIE